MNELHMVVGCGGTRLDEAALGNGGEGFGIRHKGFGFLGCAVLCSKVLGGSGGWGGWFSLSQPVGEGRVKIFCSRSRFSSATRD